MRFQVLTSVLLLVVLNACGGGGSDSAGVGSPGSGQSASTGSPSGGTLGTGSATPPGPPVPNADSSGTNGSPTGTTNGGGSTTPGSFTATAIDAPTDGATLSGILTVHLAGSGIENVELLPPTGYAPVYARGTVSPDKTSATLVVDTTTLPYTKTFYRIAAFNAPTGQGGSEITAMSPRIWMTANLPPFSATIVAAPDNGASLGPGIVHLEVSGVGMEIVNLWAPAERPIAGVFTVNPERTRATLEFDTRPYVPTDGSTAVLPWRISAFNTQTNTLGPRQINPMPERQWRFCANPVPACP